MFGPKKFEFVLTHPTTGEFVEMRRNAEFGSDTRYEAFVYEYEQVGANNLIKSVELRHRLNTSSWTTVRRAEYTYYGASELNGNEGDLKKVTIKANSSGPALETTYYRYYKDGEANGYEHGLKFVFEPESYARMAAALQGQEETAQDASVALYADYSYQYDSEQRVSLTSVQGAGCACSGGLGSLEFSYYDRKVEESATYIPDYNHWRVKTTETLPDGNENIVFTNEYGQIMLEVFHDPDTDEGGPDYDRKWANYYHYDTKGRLDWKADPTAVTGYDEASPDLLWDYYGYNYAYLSDDEGLITRFVYSDEFDSPVATSTTPGRAAGYLKAIHVQEGETGLVVLQSFHDYYKFSDGARSIYLPASATAYVGDGSTLTTSYGYTVSGVHVEHVTTLDPSEAETQVVFDSFGRPTWVKDADGFLHYTAYDPISGGVNRAIVDVDIAMTAHYVNLPAGWTTPGGGGTHILTTSNNDFVGRPWTITEANYSNNSTLTDFRYNDAIKEARVYSARSGNGYLLPTVITRNDQARGYVETLAMASSASPSNLGAEAISNLNSLTRAYFNYAGQVDHVDVYFDLAGVVYSTDPDIGEEGENYRRTTFAYDNRGRQNRVVRPDGTIYRTVYDGLGRPLSEWIGDDDEPATGFWSEDNRVEMRKLRSYVYDGGGVGANRTIQMTDSLGRVTKTELDYRGRLSKVTLPDPDVSDTVLPPTLQTFYDNLGRVMSTIDAANQTTTYDYDPDDDPLTRIVRVTLPDPDGTPAIENTPVIFQEFNARGLLISQTDPEGRVTTYAYDGAGRMKTLTGPDPDGSGTIYSAPVTHYQYDDLGNLLYVTDPLGHQTNYEYDVANRLTDVYQPDPDGFGSLPRLHTHYAYDSAGRLLSLTDPVGNATNWFYDDAGRVTAEINQHGYTRTFAYDAAGRLSERVDRLGRKIEFSYNDLDQVAEERWYEGTALVRTLTFDHDDTGWLEGASDVAAAYTYVPDDAGRLKTETQVIGGLLGGGAIEYASQYNDAGFRTQLTAKIDGTADFKNNYVPDALQRLWLFTQQGNGGNTVAAKTFDLEYNRAGQLRTCLQIQIEDQARSLPGPLASGFR